MEIAKALWQLSYAMSIFAGYLLFTVFVAPFGLGFAAFASAWISFRGRSYMSAAVAVFTGILLEVFAFGSWIAVASWIFGNPVQYRRRPPSRRASIHPDRKESREASGRWRRIVKQSPRSSPNPNLSL
jgi:hypothetical protein